MHHAGIVKLCRMKSTMTSTRLSVNVAPTKIADVERRRKLLKELFKSKRSYEERKTAVAELRKRE